MRQSQAAGLRNVIGAQTVQTLPPVWRSFLLYIVWGILWRRARDSLAPRDLEQSLPQTHGRRRNPFAIMRAAGFLASCRCRNLIPTANVDVMIV
jgi:hypothetical protein